MKNVLPFSVTIACAAAALTLHWSYVHNTPVAAAQPARHVMSVPRSNGMCALSVIDQIKAVDAFAKLVPVFRHPRCFNCHGNFDITNKDEHTGATAVPKDLDFRTLLNVDQRIRLHAECGSCHNQINGKASRPTLKANVTVSGWMMAPAPMQWVKAKDNEQLCVLVKRFEDHPDMFIDHVASDHGEIQFVEAALAGNRALDSANMDLYDVVSDPPPVTIEKLIENAMGWARLVGSHWKDSDDCGCAKPKVELIMRGEITGKSQGQTIGGEFNSSVMLEPDTLSVYQGTGTVTMSNFKFPVPGNCSVANDMQPGKVVVKEVRFAADNKDDITLRVLPGNTGGTHTIMCPGFPQPLTMPIFASMGQWRYAHGRDLQGGDYLFKDFQITASSATGRTMLGRKEITRTASAPGVDVTAKTIFEIWTVPRGQ
jgi:hypothetical protein